MVFALVCRVIDVLCCAVLCYAVLSTNLSAGIRLMEEVRAVQVASWAPEVAHTWDTNEQLAEMLLLRGGEGDVLSALQAYEAAIAIYPNR